MKLLRNPEMIFVTLLLACGAVVFTVTAFLCGGSLGWLMVSAWVFFLLCFYIFTWRRYAAIAKLSSSIDRILHGEELSIADSREGELSVLHSELQKMLNRLGEQAEALKKDKVGLSNGLADISHQLRTPLTSMNLTVSMLRNPDLAPERRLTLLRELSQSLSRIDWLVETLLKLSKIDAGTAVFRKEKVWARELLEKAGETLLIPMELKEQQLILSVEEESFLGDLQWSSEAMGNILKNCMEHTEVGGIIRVEVSETALYTQFVISDNGPGFCPEDIPHLFERFYKGSNASPESVGIGLALARRIVQEQNGVLNAANGTQGGAQFTIRFYKGVV